MADPSTFKPYPHQLRLMEELQQMNNRAVLYDSFLRPWMSRRNPWASWNGYDLRYPLVELTSVRTSPFRLTRREYHQILERFWNSTEWEVLEKERMSARFTPPPVYRKESWLIPSLFWSGGRLYGRTTWRRQGAGKIIRGPLFRMPVPNYDLNKVVSVIRRHGSADLPGTTRVLA